MSQKTENKPYIFYRYANSEGLETIQVPLRNGDIVYMCAESRNGDKSVILFSDPAKLAPFMDRINAGEHREWLENKHQKAQNGLKTAQKQAKHFSPLPVGSVGCFLDGKLRFDDGITRTTELIYQGADFIPLEMDVQTSKKLRDILGINEMPIRRTAEFTIPNPLGAFALHSTEGPL